MIIQVKEFDGARYYVGIHMLWLLGKVGIYGGDRGSWRNELAPRSIDWNRIRPKGEL